jgi:hypothetical protein
MTNAWGVRQGHPVFYTLLPYIRLDKIAVFAAVIGIAEITS